LIEHRALDISVEIVNYLKSLLPSAPGTAVAALGATPGDEWHALPSLMAAAISREAGLRDVNFGANVPVELLPQAAARLSARIVWLSITMPPSKALRGQIQSAARQLAPSNATLVVGGQSAAEACPADEPNVRCLNSMAELSGFIAAMDR
jgi:hypothetical protein